MKLQWKYNGNSTWSARGNGGFDYIIEMSPDGDFCSSGKSPGRGLAVVESSNLPHAKARCQGVEDRDNDLPKPGIIDQNMPNVPTDLQIEARAALEKAGMEVVSVNRSMFLDESVIHFAVRPKTRTNPAPKPRTYAERVIADELRALSWPDEASVSFDLKTAKGMCDSTAALLMDDVLQIVGPGALRERIYALLHRPIARE